MERYHRQRLRIGDAAQARLGHARILVVGTGGLGCPALLYLAGAGIGTLGIIDHDTVDLTNLHRQVLFTTDDLGRNKAEAAANRLAALNPDITLHAYAEELTTANAVGLFAAYDLILDGTDSFAATYLINDTALKLGKPFIHGAMQGSEGRVALFGTDGGACYRCLYPTPPQAAIQNCAEAGIIGALAGITGSAMAMEAIHYHIGRPALAGRLWILDTATMESRTLSLPERADCLCGQSPDTIVPEYASPSCALAEVEEIPPAALGNALLIDVREREEWDEGHIASAHHLPLSAIRQNPGCFAPYQGQDVVLYCQRGSRSRTAAGILLRAGFTGIRSLAGGIEGWQLHR